MSLAGQTRLQLGAGILAPSQQANGIVSRRALTRTRADHGLQQAILVVFGRRFRLGFLALGFRRAQ